jgi:stage II sporulation protein AA (anti-sigma F factor antagonist)
MSISDDELRFVVTVADDGDGTAIVAAHGELDSYAAEPFNDTLRSIVKDASFRRVVLDFSKVTFLDSGGVAVLFDAAKLASSRDALLTLIANDVRVTKIVELTGLGRMLDVQKSVADVIGDAIERAVDGSAESGRASV